MHDLDKLPNAEGYSHSTETEQQTTRGRGARRFKKEEEVVREYRKRRRIFDGDSETQSSRLNKNLAAAIPT